MLCLLISFAQTAIIIFPFAQFHLCRCAPKPANKKVLHTQVTRRFPVAVWRLRLWLLSSALHLHQPLPSPIRQLSHCLTQQSAAPLSWLSSPPLRCAFTWFTSKSHSFSAQSPNNSQISTNRSASCCFDRMHPTCLSTTIDNAQTLRMDGGGTNQTSQSHGEGPELCSVDCSSYFQLCQHCAINRMLPLLFLIVVKLHHCPSQTRHLSLKQPSKAM